MLRSKVLALWSLIFQHVMDSRSTSMHQLTSELLEAAFGNHENIKTFRMSTDFQEAGMAPEKVKQACNLLGYEIGCKEFLKDLNMERLPSRLCKLKQEIAQARSHMVRHCPPKWKEAMLITLGALGSDTLVRALSDRRA